MLQPCGRDPPPSPNCGHRSDRAVGAHQAQTGAAGPKEARKALAALLQYSRRAAIPAWLVIAATSKKQCGWRQRTSPPKPIYGPPRAHLGPMLRTSRRGPPAATSDTSCSTARCHRAPPPHHRHPAAPDHFRPSCTAAMEGKTPTNLQDAGKEEPSVAASPKLRPVTSADDGDGGAG
jgi:hypothetical protein